MLFSIARSWYLIIFDLKTYVTVTINDGEVLDLYT